MPDTPANTPEEWRLSELNQSIEQLEAQSTQLQVEHHTLAKDVSRATWQVVYLRAARALRAPAASFDLWPLGVLVVGPLTAGFLSLVLIAGVTGSNLAGVLAFILAAGLSALGLAALLYHPSQVALPAAVAEAESRRQFTAVQSKGSVKQLATVNERLTAAIAQRRDLMASGLVQRAALLQRDWKTMPDAEWEDFVVEACRTLGASVDRLPRSNQNAANLVARYRGHSVAIVTYGEGHNVNSSAVQAALTSMQRLGCGRAAVIINRRFTGAAQDFARHNGCKAIGLEEFPDFVLGKVEL
ncbi:MAG: restriction endonuclease [Pirellulales bacterium]|nr:restriction endonuclease [Pirellulales bacterium]